MKTMIEIEVLTKKFADARSLLGDRVSALNDEIDTAKKAHMRGIKGAVATAAAAQDELAEALEGSRALFEKKKTQTFHGIRVGFQKGKGRIEFGDPDKVVELIQKYFPDEFDVLVTIANLPASSLKKLGIEIDEAGDAVFIKPVDSEVDKMVDALLGSAIAEEVEG